MQVLVAIVLIFGLLVAGFDINPENIPSWAWAFATIVAGLVTVAIITPTRFVDWRTALSTKGVTAKRLVFFFIASLLGIIAANIMQELLALPDMLASEMMGLSTSAMGIATIGFVGPIVAEVVFREGVMGSYLRGGVKPWVAIVVSAVVFGVSHLNPAQTPFAIVVGLMLGYVYWQTGSIVVPCIIHVFNNCMSLLQTYILGDAMQDYSLVAEVGGTAPAIITAIALAAASVYTFKSTK